VLEVKAGTWRHKALLQQGLSLLSLVLWMQYQAVQTRGGIFNRAVARFVTTLEQLQARLLPSGDYKLGTVVRSIPGLATPQM
jgi:hypothetical protein